MAFPSDVENTALTTFFHENRPAANRKAHCYRGAFHFGKNTQVGLPYFFQNEKPSALADGFSK
tara:strand:- start:60453 stop:60641 length:189 start_codon:yes stop_codon:yes gene_type:complete